MRHGFFVLLCCLCVAAFALAADPVVPPTLAIPKVTKAPVLDGKLEPGEWNGAASFTGVANYLLGGIVPNVQQVSFYLTYDDKYLYMAMHSPLPKGTYPTSRIKRNDDEGVIFEDHIEFQILKHDRSKATLPGYGFYKVMANARGATADKWWYNGTDASEHLWNSGGVTKCSVTPEAWTLEMSIDISRMEETNLDGKEWVMQLVRADSCIGVYFVGWVPGTWMDWKKFPSVRFDPDAAAVQLVRTGEIMNGELDAQLAFTAKKQTEVSATVSVVNAKGEGLYRREQRQRVPAGERVEMNFTQSGLKLDNKDNALVIDAREGDKVLYSIRMPVNQLTPEYKSKYLEPWLTARPQAGDWDYTFAYLPYSNAAQCSVDIDFFGVAEELRGATAFKVSVTDAQGKPVAEADAPVSNMIGSTVVRLPDLAEGKYVANFSVLKGDRELAQKRVDFVRKRYAWERNTVGISDEVIPPYTPLATTQPAGKAPVIKPWNRAYEIASSGLPQQIVVDLQEQLGMSASLLRLPARLEISAGSRLLSPDAGEVKVVEAKPNTVKLTATQKHGGVRAAVDAAMDYDGWYEVALTLSPAEGQPGTIDRMDLVLDLGDQVDTLYARRDSDFRAGNKFGAVPAGKGVVWESTELRPVNDAQQKDWKSFVPTVFLGTGSRGLWFYAWSDKGWQMADGDAVVRVERDEGGRVTLRVRMISGEVRLDKPRTLRFALLAAPVKPLPDNYRVMTINHDTPGYRTYGDSVDGYALHGDEQIEMMRRFMLYGPQTEAAKKQHSHQIRRRREFTQGMIMGAPQVLYGSTYMTGAGMEEFDTFAGEWLGKTNFSLNPDVSYNGKPNYSGSVVFDTPRELHVTGVAITQSYVDNFVWYHQKLMQLGVNGTWWDNLSTFPTPEYDPQTGEVESVWNTYIRRQLTKRLNVAGWQVMRPPTWVQNMHDDFSWNQVMWLVENDWYIDAEGFDYLDHMDIDTFRAMARTKAMQLVATPWPRYPVTKDKALEEHIRRSITGTFVLHDITRFTVPPELLRQLKFHVEFDSAAKCKFRGYWDVDAKLADTRNASVKASVYTNASRKTAALILVNTAKADFDLAGASFSRTLNGKTDAPAAFDGETGAPVRLKVEGDRLVVDEALVVKAHEYRVLVIGGQ
jgi:hypothetical protein